MAVEIPLARLRELFDYDPETGLFARRYVAGGSSARNTRWAGKPGMTRVHKQGYRIGYVDGRTVYAHRAAWALHYGAWPADEIDHINHDPSDNRIANLRAASRTENTRNHPRMRHNTSGHTGVYRRKNRWAAMIRVDRVLHRLGSFENLEDAVASRKAAELRFGFHTNHGMARASHTVRPVDDA